MLWTNSSPSNEFAQQHVTVADFSGYDYIGVEYRGYMTNTQTATTMMSVDDFNNTINHTINTPTLSLAAFNADPDNYPNGNRHCYKVSNTEIAFTSGFRGSGPSGGACIPVNIFGLK